LCNRTYFLYFVDNQIPIDRAEKIKKSADKNIELILKGCEFGEQDGYEPDCYFKFKLVSFDHNYYKMLVLEPGNSNNPGPKELDIFGIASLVVVK
jgi:hypothetical protein